jgi:ketosteroid isomerase-like protein
MSELRAETDELRELERVDSEWAAAAAAGDDVERILSFWADDAIVFAPGSPPIAGKDAIRNYVTTSLAIPGFSIAWQTETFTLSEARDLAYGIGPNRVTFNDERGEPQTVHGQAVTIWRKDAGGWKCVIDIWNEAAPPS